MAPIIPEGKNGDACVKHYTMDADASAFSHLRAVVTGDRGAAAAEGTYAQLLVNNYLVMSDTRMEKDTNREFLRMASISGGDVLIGGLGLGVILIPLLQLKDIKSVTVIEKSSGVIALVHDALMKRLGKLGKKLIVINADILTWKPPAGKKWDCIYFDIWADISVDNLESITKLKRKFARRLNRDSGYCWMGAWQEDRLRSLKRSGRWR
jgi:spermidine synthase